MVVITKVGMLGCKACDVMDKVLEGLASENVKVEKLSMEEGKGLDLTLEFDIKKFPFLIIKNEETGSSTTYSGIVSETPVRKKIESVL